MLVLGSWDAAAQGKDVLFYSLFCCNLILFYYYFFFFFLIFLFFVIIVDFRCLLCC